jgi:hypothetical protein
MMGWTRISDADFFRQWKAPDGTTHTINVYEAVRGWAYIWTRGLGFTLCEGAGYPTLEACVEAVWGEVFAGAEQRHQLLVENTRRILAELGR